MDEEDFQNFVWETYQTCCEFAHSGFAKKKDKEMLNLLRGQMLKYIKEMGDEATEEN